MCTCVQVLFAGMAVAAIWNESGLDTALHTSLQQWIFINGDVLSTVLLPLLVFASAFNSSVHIMQGEMWHFLWLAFPMVAVGTLLVRLHLRAHTCQHSRHAIQDRGAPTDLLQLRYCASGRTAKISSDCTLNDGRPQAGV
jgi:hypothetical protein